MKERRNEKPSSYVNSGENAIFTVFSLLSRAPSAPICLRIYFLPHEEHSKHHARFEMAMYR